MRDAMRNRVRVTLAAILLLPLSACATSPGAPPAQSTPSARSTTVTPQGTTGGIPMDATRVRFSTGDAEIVVQVVDNPTSRDLLSKLPLTLTFEEFAGREKISYLPECLTTEGSPGAAPRNGHLIYFVPWGNLGFFYNAVPDAGVDDDVITIGTVESGMDQLARLETGQVTAETIEPRENG
jgi:hypothetical protein